MLGQVGIRIAYKKGMKTLIMLFGCLLLSFSLFAEEAVDYISICGRTSSVKAAILEQIEDIRGRQQDKSAVSCDQIRISELNKIEILTIDQMTSSLSVGDFADLKSLKYLDLGEHFQLTQLPKGIFKGLHLRQVYVGKNSLTDISINNIRNRAAKKNVIFKNADEESEFENLSDFKALDFIHFYYKEQIKEEHNLPLDIKGSVDALEPREEALMARQIIEVKKAFRTAIVDFFKARISFENSGDVVVYDNQTGLLTIKIQKDTVVGFKQINEAIAQAKSLSVSSEWYKSGILNFENLEKAVEQSLLALAEHENKLKSSLKEMSDILSSREVGTSFNPNEVVLMRKIQTDVMLNLQLVLNQVQRWSKSSKDAAFSLNREAGLITTWGSLIYKTYSDWFLKQVFENQNLGQLLDEAYTVIPAGSIKSMMNYKIEKPYKDLLNTSNVKINDDRINQTKLIAEKHTLSSFNFTKEFIARKFKKTNPYSINEILFKLSLNSVENRPFGRLAAIKNEDIETLKPTLKAGDIILTKEDNYLQHAFWSEAMIYLGPTSLWSSLKQSNGVSLSDDAWIKKEVLPAYFQKKNNADMAVLKLHRKQAEFQTLEEALKKDFVVVLRLKIESEYASMLIADSIKRSLENPNNLQRPDKIAENAIKKEMFEIVEVMRKMDDGSVQKIQGVQTIEELKKLMAL